MSTGNESIDYLLVEISIPLFAVNPAYENAVINKDEILWLVGYDFNVERIDDEWSELSTQSIITLKTKDDKKKIAELIVKSFFEITAGLSTNNKKILLHVTVNQTMAQAQGAWAVMHTNPSIASLLPPATDHFQRESEEVKNLLRNKWGKWSRK